MVALKIGDGPGLKLGLLPVFHRYKYVELNFWLATDSHSLISFVRHGFNPR